MSDAVNDYTRQGVNLAHQGRLADAVLCFQEVVRLDPHNGHAYNNLANVFLFQGRYDEAVANYRHALTLLPNEAGINNHLSYAHSKRGNGAEAETYARRALTLKPDFAEAYNHLGIALGLQEKYDDAEACYFQALRLDPNLAKAHSNLAQLHLLQRRFDDAFNQAELALRLDPSLAESHASLAAVYLHHDMLEEAFECCRRALQLNPQLPEAHFHQATAYLKQGRLADAAALCRAVLSVQPGHSDMEYVLGMVALKENRLADALAAFDKLAQKKPNDAQVHFNRALVMLLGGNYEEGWPEYEWRWRWNEFVIRPFTEPMWDGAPLDGKTILLHAEQGLGDTLQFIRYAPLVKKKGGTVLVACPEALHKLLSRSPGIDQLVAQETFSGRTDEHAPFLSLPRLFKTTLTSIPAEVPYVFAEPALIETWRAELAGDTGFKIGIAWQGNPRHPDDRFRSMPLEHFAPLRRVPGVRWYSLQKKHGLADLAKAPFEVADLAARLDETTEAFVDTAAVMMSLDLVITSDTAIAHLAGALGVPVWVALRFAPIFAGSWAGRTVPGIRPCACSDKACAGNGRRCSKAWPTPWPRK
jgi:Flp pilus assembly protein TadD